MAETKHMNLRFTALAGILLGLGVGCSDALDGASGGGGSGAEQSAPDDTSDVGDTSSGEVEPGGGTPVVGTGSELGTDGVPLQPSDAGAGGSSATDGTDAGGSGGSGTVLGPLPKFIGNITTGNAIDTGGFVFSDHWDQITPENAGKWGSVQRNVTNPPNWATLDALYDYAQQKGIVFKEHAFVWGSQQPSGTITEADVRSWMQGFCTRYPNTRVIDVVNEPPPHTEPSYANAIGGGTNGNWQWIVNSFLWAREYCPNAVLILNDYNNIEYANQSQHFVDIARAVLAAGGPIDALGAQTHGLSGNVSGQTMRTLLNKLHDDTGLPVYITEYDIDIDDDAAQLAKFQDHFSFFLETEWIRGVTIWGWIYGRTWVPSSGLIRNGAPRPSMTWLMEQLDRPVPQ
jgi:endo-1,4-beta-xylanase